MTATPASTVALLGTGTMGAGMARVIAGAGLDLRVWNRTRSRAEPLADVATVCSSVAEAVAGADLVVTMLYDADSVAEAMEAARGALGADAIWVQQSTVGVDGTTRLAALAEDLGVAFVDAPVLGTRKPAADGALVVLASGPEDLRERVQPLFEAIGSRTVWVGEAGAGSRLKLVANGWILTVLDGVARSLALAGSLDLDPRLFLEAVRGGAVDAPYVQMKGAAMLAGDFEPAFALSGALKDAELLLAAAVGARAPVASVALVRDHLAAAVEAGYGDLDMAAVYLSLGPDASPSATA